MRQRLLRSTLAIALVAVVTLGVPLLLLARHEVWSSARESLAQQATSIAAGLEDELDAGRPVDLARFVSAQPDRRIEVVTPAGRRLYAGPEIRGERLAETVRAGRSSVTVLRDAEPVAHRADEVTLLVTGLALLGVACAVALALAQARRLSRPLSELLDRADALGRGEFDQPSWQSGIEEIDGVATVLDRSGRDIAAMLDLQRHFASDAAHQLRTPLTGIGLRLDELADSPDTRVRREAENALAQVERLDAVITALLARASGDAAAPTLVDLGALLPVECEPWSVALREQGRDLVISTGPDLLVKARREHVAGVVSCLLDNALHHGRGTVTVTAALQPERVLVSVRDEGDGVPSELRARVFDRRFSGSDGTGIGLSLARSLAMTEGGVLSLASGSEFVLDLPRARAEQR